MPACETCNHPNRLDIDRAICRGENLSGLARSYGVSRDSLENHGKNHISYQLQTAIDRQMGRHGEEMLKDIEGLIDRTKGILDRAEQEGKLDTALKGIGQVRSTYELIAKVGFDLHQARIEEERLQLERDQAQLQNSFWQSARDALSENELGLLQLLHSKVEGRDSSRGIINEATNAGYLPVTQIRFEPGDEVLLDPEERHRLIERLQEADQAEGQDGEAEEPTLGPEPEPANSAYKAAEEPEPEGEEEAFGLGEETPGVGRHSGEKKPVRPLNRRRTRW